jgi:hypothetical protein
LLLLLCTGKLGAPLDAKAELCWLVGWGPGLPLLVLLLLLSRRLGILALLEVLLLLLLLHLLLVLLFGIINTADSIKDTSLFSCPEKSDDESALQLQHILLGLSSCRRLRSGFSQNQTPKPKALAVHNPVSANPM